MNKEEHIKIIEELLEGVKELNGEYQEGWENVIENAERLITQLKVKKDGVLGDVIKWIPIHDNGKTYETQVKKHPKTLIKFDTGETCEWVQDEWPFAICTHFKEIK